MFEIFHNYISKRIVLVGFTRTMAIGMAKDSRSTCLCQKLLEYFMDWTKAQCRVQLPQMARDFFFGLKCFS